MKSVCELAEVKTLPALSCFAQLSKRCYLLAYEKPFTFKGSKETASMAPTPSFIESLPQAVIAHVLLPKVMMMTDTQTTVALSCITSEPFQKLSACEKLPHYVKTTVPNWQERITAEYEKKQSQKLNK